MKISCPACAAKYSIADEKVQDRLAKIRCRKCGTTIVIDGKVSPPLITSSGEASAEPTASAPTEVGLGAVGPAPGEYSVDMGDNDQRTMTVAQLKNAFQQRQISVDTFVWSDGMTDWQRIGDVPALLQQISPAGVASSGVVSSAGGSDMFTPRAATASVSERSAAADLFGGIESAGGEEDIQTSAPESAPAPPMAEAAAATGARNESSVLFSLSALTGGGGGGGGIARPGAAAAAAPAAPAAPIRRAATASSRDDSGLIDLKALSTAVNAPGGNDPFGGGGGISPLGLAPPVVSVAPLATPFGGGVSASHIGSDLDMRPSRGGKGPMIIGAAILIVGLAGVAVFAMKSGSEAGSAATGTEAPATTQETKPAVPVAPAVKEAPAAAKTEEPTAAPPPTGTAPPPAAPAAKAAAALTKPTAPVHHKTSSSSTSTASKPAAAAPAPAAAEPKPAAAAPAPAAPKVNKCNCKPTDLLCAMKCSTH
ncbi:MAG TPA: zinc-ribbon domain-containing protein [Polyangiaceae bacterium]|nr:zinc-ribbon domain-containing protein [Polyangiaceae bacterium]